MNVPMERVENRILSIRGNRVMLDTGRGWQTRINEVLKHQISDRKAS